MDDIERAKAQIWNDRVSQCIEDHGFRQESFAKAFKERYGTGTQANISRWINVGNRIAGKKDIGYPSFENMKRIADFFGVSVGYLTGETDYKTFEMEKACKYFELSQKTGEAITKITKIRARDNATICRPENSAALQYLLTAPNFTEFLRDLCNLAWTIKKQKNPVDYVAIAKSKVAPDLFDTAIECKFYEEFDCWDMYKEDHGKDPTQEIREATRLLCEAEHRATTAPFEDDRAVRSAKYDLNEIYFKLIDDIVCDEHLSLMTTVNDMVCEYGIAKTWEQLAKIKTVEI